MVERLEYAHPLIINRFFSQDERQAVERLGKAASLYGVDADLLMHHFATFSKERVLGLKDLPLDERLKTPGLEKMLYCDPEVVFPVYRAFIRHLFKNDPRPDVMADRLDREARERFDRYLEHYPSPEDLKGLPKPDKLPFLAKIRFWHRGLPSNMAGHWFVERFLQIMKDKYSHYDLSDRQGHLFEFLPHWWRSPSTFSNRISLSNLKRTDTLGVPKSHQYLDIRDAEKKKYRHGFEYSYPLDYWIQKEPFLLKQAYRQMYPAFARRTLPYRLASVWDRLTGSHNAKKLEAGIHQEVQAAVSGIDAYRLHFDRMHAIDADVRARPAISLERMAELERLHGKSKGVKSKKRKKIGFAEKMFDWLTR